MSPIRRHIDALWTLLTRDEPIVAPYSSLLPLPRPYVVPGGRFRELYYWDSYFVMLGLAESGRRDLVQDMATNFANLIDTYGHAPNGTRSYYLSRSHPPFFFEMVGLLSPWDPAAAFARYLPELKTEYAFWMDGAMISSRAARIAAQSRSTTGRSSIAIGTTATRRAINPFPRMLRWRRRRHGEPTRFIATFAPRAESGWDFSSRWFADARTIASIDTTEIIPVDLNALMFGLEDRSGRLRTGRRYRLRRGFRASARPRVGRRLIAFSGINPAAPISTIAGRRSGQSTMSPPRLSIRCSPTSRATRRRRSAAKAVEAELLKPGGIVTTTLDTGQQWDRAQRMGAACSGSRSQAYQLRAEPLSPRRSPAAGWSTSRGSIA